MATTPKAQTGRALLKRGSDAMETLKQEQAKAEARREAQGPGGVYRFYVGKDTKGKYLTHEVAVLDEDARNCPFAHEHTVPGPGNNFSEARTHICVDEVDNCVLCRAKEQNLGEEYKHPTYSMYVTILDMTPYTVKNGPRAGEVIEATRKLMVIPQGSVAQFLKIFELCFKMHGTTRGLVMLLTKNQQTDARCGIPQMLDNGMLFDLMDDEELDDFANDEVKRDGKVVKQEGEDIDPIDYEVALAPPDQKVLRKLYGLPASVGSEEDEEETIGTSRMGRRRRAVGAEGGSTDEAATTAPPARTRSQRAAQAAAPAEPEAGTSSRRRRGAAPVNESVEDAEVVKEEPAPTSRRRRAAGAGVDEIPF